MLTNIQMLHPYSGGLLTGRGGGGDTPESLLSGEAEDYKRLWFCILAVFVFTSRNTLFSWSKSKYRCVIGEMNI